MDWLSFRLPDQFIESYADKEVPWGLDIGAGNTLSELTFITKYSMLREDGTKERWHETCERVINGMFSILKDHCRNNGTHWNANQAMHSAKEAYDRLFHFKWTPPGRGLENMGKAIVNQERNSAQLFNCSFISTAKISTASVYLATRPFVLLMEQSLNGIGVGYDTLGAGKITLNQPILEDRPVHVVPDTREGWAEALGILLECFFFPGRHLVQFDTSKIRPAGAPLKRAGGTASGPEPLERMIEKITELLSGRDGELITDMDIMDICNLAAKAVVSGGKRRSALLALGDLDSKDFINAKNWEVFPERNGRDGWAHQSNNSVVYDSYSDVGELYDLIALNGEPGLVNLDLARTHGRLKDGKNDSDLLVAGVNPCMTGESRLLTKEYGLMPIEKLAEMSEFTVFNGDGEWRRSFAWSNGVKPVYKVELRNGLNINLTEDHVVEVKKVFGDRSRYHEFVEMEAKDLLGERIVPFLGDGSWDGQNDITPDDAVFLGIIQGDGYHDHGRVGIRNYESEVVDFINSYCADRGWEVSIHSNGSLRILDEQAMKEIQAFGMDLSALPARTLPEKLFVQNPLIVKRFLKGLFSANGSVQKKYNRISLKTTNPELASGVQQLLVALGMSAYITTNREQEIEWNNGIYTSKESYDVNVGTRWGFNKFQQDIGFLHDHKTFEVRGPLSGAVKSTDVVSVEYIGEFEVFDFNEAVTNWGWANGMKVHNCGEATLENCEFCNLNEVFINNAEDKDDFLRTLKYAYMYSKAVTLLPTPWSEVNEVLVRNRRIGTSVTGVAQFLENRSWHELKEFLDEGYNEIDMWDEKYSSWLGIRHSIKFSVIKPSGTVSIIGSSTAGAHWPTASGKFMRTQRFSTADPMVNIFKEAGYKVEEDVMNPEFSRVVYFPVEGFDMRSEKEVSLWEKAALASLLQRYWADQAVSVTLTFDPETETSQIGPVIKAYSDQLKTMSFLKIDKDVYPQMPISEVSDEEWEAARENVQNIDWSLVYDGGAGTAAEGEKFCANDTCEIPQR